MVEEKRILFYDGVCNFCNTTVQFIIKNDKKGQIYFASLQSEFAQKLLAEKGIHSLDLNSLVFYENGIIFQKSTGALQIAKYLKFPWNIGRVFLFIPRGIRDCFYDFFAKKRYRFFGKSTSCIRPSAAIKARFIEI